MDYYLNLDQIRNTLAILQKLTTTNLVFLRQKLHIRLVPVVNVFDGCTIKSMFQQHSAN